ncbi:MAG: Holliday junction resolvase RuvX [Candidatus Paceibacterota bacterium]|jgi:putative Holliday junction resolvase
MRYLGVDYGSRKVGLALSDEAGIMGFPHAVVTNTPRLVDEVCALIAREKVGVVVIGESRSLEGGENPIAKDARKFGEQIAERAGVPIFFESEVYTSAEARRLPEKEIKSRAPKKHIDVDASAAALILTSYLTRQERR